MKILSKIKSLNIGSKAKGILSSGKTVLSSLSKKNKAIIATGLSVIAVGGAAVATSSTIKNHKLERETDNSIIMEVENSTDTNDIYGPQLNGETPTSAVEDKKEATSKDEFLSDKVKDVEIKDNEDKKEEIKEDITKDNKNVESVDAEAVVGYVAGKPSGEEIVEKVEYSGNAVIVNGKAYETQEDADRAQQQIGSVEIIDNNNYVIGEDGNYYVSNESANNSNVGEVISVDITDNISTDVVYIDETVNSDNFYYDEENDILWGSAEDYMLSIDPTYGLQINTNYVEEETVVEENVEVVDNDEIITTEDVDAIYYGPDGKVYTTLESYNDAVNKYVEESKSEEASVVVETKEEVKTETKEEVKTETKTETKKEVKEEKKEETKKETKTEVKENTKEETKAEVKEEKKETKEETKPEVKEETKEETKTEVKEENKDNQEVKSEDEFDYLELLEDGKGILMPDGNYWSSEEDYYLITGQNQDTASKTR